jgi:glyoxylase-like metal-dependent hydrolase (beta-lactamase superfamily II)
MRAASAHAVRAAVLLAVVCPRPVGAQQVTSTAIAGPIHRIDGAIDNIVVSAGPDGLLMIDTGYPFAVDDVKEALLRIAGKAEPDVLVLTHQHHGFAAPLYAGPDTRIIAHTEAAERMRRTALMAGVVLEPFPEAAWPDSVFEDSITLRFNGEDIAIFHLPAAHTGGDLAAWFPRSRVLAAGDVFVPHLPWISLDAGADATGLLRGLDALLDRLPADAIVVPGHDRTSTVADVRGLRDVVAEASDSVRARIERGASLLEIQRAGLPEHLAAWEGEAIGEAFFLESLYRSFVPADPHPAAGITAYENGLWYDDGGFRRGTLYAVEGVLTATRPPRVDRTVDLQGGWAVPAFGEAHTHRLGAAESLADDHAAFVRDGVFFVMVQDPAAPLSGAHAEAVAATGSADVLYTQGVITPSWGVLPTFYELMAHGGRYGPGVSGPDLAGDLYFVVDDVASLEVQWPEIRARNDAFVKIFVAFSDDIARRRASPERYGAELPRYSARPGVTPEVLARAVELAHADGLQVSAHIETAADFRTAVAAGVDWIAHMPASWQVGPETGVADDAPWELTIEDAFAARAARVPVITTLSVDPADPRRDAFRRVHARNLATLVEAGAPLAIGSDLFDGTSVDEALHLATFDALTDAQVFALLAVQTPRLLFPGRRIGHLREGYEATFLVLGGDPTRDIAAIRDIRMRVKKGVPIP